MEKELKMVGEEGTITSLCLTCLLYKLCNPSNSLTEIDRKIDDFNQRWRDKGIYLKGVISCRYYSPKPKEEGKK